MEWERDFANILCHSKTYLKVHGVVSWLHADLKKSGKGDEVELAGDTKRHLKKPTLRSLRVFKNSACPQWAVIVYPVLQTILLSWCFTSTETIRVITDGRR